MYGKTGYDIIIMTMNCTMIIMECLSDMFLLKMFASRSFYHHYYILIRYPLTCAHISPAVPVSLSTAITRQYSERLGPIVTIHTALTISAHRITSTVHALSRQRVTSARLKATETSHTEGKLSPKWRICGVAIGTCLTVCSNPIGRTGAALHVAHLL